jgi:hypothetical protein
MAAAAALKSGRLIGKRCAKATLVKNQAETWQF